jgi:hypothetical protein
MKAALSGRASFVIAHRLSTIQEFDQILVIDDRQEVQRGRHAGLLPPWASTVICTTVSKRSTLIRILRAAAPCMASSRRISLGWLRVN